MRAVVQRVKNASVSVNGVREGQIDQGLLVFLGISNEDEKEDQDYIIRKITNLRIFEDENGIMNKSVQDVGGAILLISQFTLYGDARKGNRPSYIRAAKEEVSRPMYEQFILSLEATGIPIEMGVFGADMMINLLNDGPVTILLDSEKKF